MYPSHNIIQLTCPRHTSSESLKSAGGEKKYLHDWAMMEMQSSIGWSMAWWTGDGQGRRKEGEGVILGATSTSDMRVVCNQPGCLEGIAPHPGLKKALSKGCDQLGALGVLPGHADNLSKETLSHIIQWIHTLILPFQCIEHWDSEIGFQQVGNELMADVGPVHTHPGSGLVTLEAYRHVGMHQQL